MPNTVVVIGGGIAGLAVAYELIAKSSALASPPEIVCLEASGRPGGNIRTESDGGFVCEWGPNGFLDNSPPTLDLVRRLGIGDRLLPSDQAAAKRFIFRDGKLRQLPSGALSFLTSDVLTWGGKLSVLGEPFRKAKRDDVEESVHDFAARRIGPEAARVLVAAMVSGIYAGDARSLSLQATFPKMFRMERDHGGLVRAMLARKRDAASSSGGGPAGPGGRLTSFRSGFEELPAAVARALGGIFRASTGVSRIGNMGVRGFRVHPDHGAPIDAGAVVLACPSWQAARIVAETDDTLSRAMDAIPSASLAVVHMGFAVEDLPGTVDGFGFLVPRGESARTLGTLWSSSIFPGHRAPDGHILLTTMIGGATDPEAVGLDDDALCDAVLGDLAVTMGITKQPGFRRIFRHPRGIPQYTIGHVERLATIERRLSGLPGLLACGNSYRGISVNACIAEAPEVADAALAAIRR